MPRSTSSPSTVEQVAAAISTANGARFENDLDRLRRPALAALKRWPDRPRQWSILPPATTLP